MRHLFLVLFSSTAALVGQHGIEVVGADGLPQAKVAAVRRLTLDALDNLGAAFPVEIRPFTVVVHRELASVPGDVRRSLHEGAAGVALLARLEVHLILERAGIEPPNDLRTVVRHEVVHVLLYQLAGGHVPRWFHEGLAQALTDATYLGVSEEDIAFHASTGNLLSFSSLRTDFPRRPSALRTAYAQSFSFVSFLQRRIGLDALLNVATKCGPDMTFPEAFLKDIGMPLVTFEEQWVHYIKTGSGAAWRVLLTSCFGLSMVAALPLLALAGARRWNRDLESRRKLEMGDAAESEDTVEDER